MGQVIFAWELPRALDIEFNALNDKARSNGYLGDGTVFLVIIFMDSAN